MCVMVLVFVLLIGFYVCSNHKCLITLLFVIEGFRSAYRLAKSTTGSSSSDGSFLPQCKVESVCVSVFFWGGGDLWSGTHAARHTGAVWVLSL